MRNHIVPFSSLAFLFFLLSVFTTTTSVSANNNDNINGKNEAAFLECLKQNSHPNYPISPSIYVPSINTSSYPSVLQAYIRNLRFNESTTPKPKVIVAASHVSHIQAAVVCGKQHDMLMKIRSGGHDYEGLSYVSDAGPNFFVLDMFNLRAINVNVTDETAWVQVGATLGELYYRIAEKSNVHGFPAGVCPTVGVGGHFSGGGYGNMMRKYGAAVDNILDAQLVDVNGRFLDRESMGEDLFWAITGGGGASFAVVVAYKIRLVAVPEKVTVFNVERTYDQNAVSIAHRFQQVGHKLPKDLFIRMNVGVLNRGEQGNTIRTAFVAMFLGDSAKLLSVMNESFPELGVKQEDCTEMRWVESVLFWTEFPEGTPVDALLSRVPQSLTYNKRKSDYLTKPMPKSGIEFLFKKMVEMEVPFLQFNPYGGRMSEIASTAKPTPHRAGYIIKIQYLVDWNQGGAEEAKRNLGIIRAIYKYMTPFATKSRQAFLNYRDIDLGVNRHGKNSYLEGAAYGRKYFNNNFDRLVQIKTKVDPHNFFRNEQSIPVFPSSRK